MLILIQIKKKKKKKNRKHYELICAKIFGIVSCLNKISTHLCMYKLISFPHLLLYALYRYLYE